jgi:hypothetical protein
MVLTDTDMFNRFTTFCKERGCKKSTLLEKLLKKHLNVEVNGPLVEGLQICEDWEGKGQRTYKVMMLTDMNTFNRFAVFCKERGCKRSTLLEKLVKKHLNSEGFPRKPLSDGSWVYDDRRTSTLQTRD